MSVRVGMAAQHHRSRQRIPRWWIATGSYGSGCSDPIGFVTVELPLLRFLCLLCHCPWARSFEIVKSVSEGKIYSGTSCKIMELGIDPNTTTWRNRLTDLDGNSIATNLLKLGICNINSWGVSRGAWKSTGVLVPDESTRRFAANDHAGMTDPKEIANWLNLWKLVIESRALYVEELPKKNTKTTLRPDHKLSI
jgi:hypothetical protein